MVTAVPREIAFGELIAAHNHPWVQLLYASEGVMRVRTELGVWIIPPRRALLIPPGVVHELTMLSRVNQRTLYIDTHAAGLLVGANCKVLEVSPLLRELIVALSIEPFDYPARSRGEALARLILSELAAMETVPIAVPWPRDRRLQAVCTEIMDHPANRRHLADYASDTGASARTLIRLFPKETGLPYRQWVQQVHLAHAFEMLARNQRRHRRPHARLCKSERIYQHVQALIGEDAAALPGRVARARVTLSDRICSNVRRLHSSKLSLSIKAENNG
jgi:AraC-like DNA-binding protein